MQDWMTQWQDLPVNTQAKGKRLAEILAGYGSVAVAFSGGVDSSLLCAVGYAVLGDRLVGITARSPVETPGDHEASVSVAQAVGFRHLLVDFDDFSTPHFAENPPDRCYHCKFARLGEIQQIAAREGLAVVVEGSNADDAGDYRPGVKAVRELGIRSPLAEAGLTKPEIRALAHAMNVPVWDRPSAPCLATRFPYGTTITREGLAQVAKGEAYLHGRGFSVVRVRHFGDTVRVEVAPDAIARLAEQHADVSAFFRELGFAYVTLDLIGYRSGSMNETLKKGTVE